MAKKMVKRARRATGMAMGAALMYFCDPQLGARRRHGRVGGRARGSLLRRTAIRSSLRYAGRPARAPA